MASVESVTRCRTVNTCLGGPVFQHCRRRSRAPSRHKFPRAATNSAQPSDQRRTVLCSLSTLVDSVQLQAYCCWQVANETWPTAVVGPSTQYVKYLTRVWPAVRSIDDGVLLARVLADEGVIGARSASGRQGPVVSTRPRRGGMRPLNPVEIVSNWAILRDACVIKWGLLDRGDDTAARQALRERVLRRLEDALRGDMALEGECLRPRAYPTVLQAVRGSTHAVTALSPFPPGLSEALLGLGGYSMGDVAAVQCDGTLQALCAALSDAGSATAARRGVEVDPQDSSDAAEVGGESTSSTNGDVEGGLLSGRTTGGPDRDGCEVSSIDDASECESSGLSTHVHVVMDNTDDLVDASAAFARACGAGCTFTAAQGATSVCWCVDQRGCAQTIALHLCDWGSVTPEMRARAAGCNINLMTDELFAGLLDVTHLDVVMDGVQWR